MDNLYFKLLKTPVFTIDDVNRFCGNVRTSRSAVPRLIKKGLVAKIRNNLYTCINGQTLAPVADRFQIASAISPTSYVSHHSAVEYYGMANQIYYEVYVSSDTPFREFSFDGYIYKRIPSKFREGVVSPDYSGGIRVTDLERTVVDNIKDFEKVGGLEEIISFLESVEAVDENKLLKYLELYDNQFLYQKCGYLLSREGRLGLSADFFDVCHRKAGKSRRYLCHLAGHKGIYKPEWGLIVPDNLYVWRNGVPLDADI